MSGSSLSKGEDVRVNAGIEKFDLKRPILDAALLPDELIQTGLSHFAGTVGSAVDAMSVAGWCTVQLHPKTDWAPVLRRAQHEMKIAAMKPESDRSRPSLDTADSLPVFHAPLSPQ